MADAQRLDRLVATARRVTQPSANIALVTARTRDKKALATSVPGHVAWSS